MMIRTTIAAKAALDDPLRLAEIYRAGLGRHWNSLRQGSVQLAALNLKASAARLQQAVKISEFPGEILDLFKHVGIVNRTARELIRASNEQGLEQLKLRAATIDPAGKSRTQLFALLCGDEVAGSSYRAHSKERPLALDQRYRDGLHSGLWSSTREAAQVLGVDQARLVKASKIAGLPDEVKLLFPGQALTFAAGWQLIQLTKLRGSDVIRQVAIAARSAIPTLSQQELMNRFVGLEGNAVNVKVKRGTAGKLVLEFHYDADDPANETRLSMMAMWLRDIKPNVR
ncbi:hypothetical protein [Paraburkholderia sp. RL18-085-BIA-A]|uniref:hypothetical protein n=2 Tax=unclassified Paraburkholderia TaxID=2615204 RepID=UPI0038B8F5C9